MAGTVTTAPQLHRPVRTIRWTWVSDASGDVSGTNVTDPVSGKDILVHGTPLAVVFIPDTGGTTPADQYDVTILDADGADILRGQGADRAQTYSDTTEQLTYGDATEPRTFDSILSLVVANAGNAKGGQIVMYFR